MTNHVPPPVTEWQTFVQPHLDRIKELEAAVWQYGEHHNECPAMRGFQYQCDCGFNAMIETLRQEAI